MSLDLFPGVSRTSRVLSIIALLGLAGSAQATLFSFASDDASSQFTFQGTAAAANNSFTLTHTSNRVPVTPKIDDNNDVLPTVAIAVGLTANVTLNWFNSLGMGGSQTHAYSATGTFSFVDPSSGAALLTIAFTNQSPAGMTIGGSMSEWFSSGGLFGSDNGGGGTVTYTSTPALFTAGAAVGANLENYGIFGGANATSTGPDDFSFTLTRVNAAGAAVPINSTTRAPSAAWNAEGSFSGSATWIPSPGAFALIGAAGLMVAGRRRR